MNENFYPTAFFYATASERNARDYGDLNEECEAYGHIGYRDPWDADYDE